MTDRSRCFGVTGGAEVGGAFGFAGGSTGAEPTGAEPTGTEPTGTEPTGTEPTGTEPTGTEPTGTEPTGTEPTGTGRLSPWRAVIGLGVVSLAADMVYEGARSVTGPLLASLGASALLVGAVTGAGEAAALVLRLVFGTWADRSGRYWALTITGYAITAVCVPLLAVTPFLAGAGLGLACALLLAERTGKAVRSPAKSALLASAASGVGLGRGFAVHKALDQLGAVAGPLLVAAVAALTGALWPALAVLAVPGAAALLVLTRLRRRMGAPSVEAETISVGAETTSPAGPASADPASADPASADPASADPVSGDPGLTARGRRDRTKAPRAAGLPPRFWWFAAAAGAASAGLVTFGVIAYHLTRESVVPVAAIPVIYAAAMGVEALAALVTGWRFDRLHGRILLVVPFLGAVVPALAFASSASVAVAGVLVWGAATGVQDSTVKALVADLVPATRRATAYGIFAAVQGSAAFGGGVLAGALYDRSLPALIGAVAAAQLVALVLLLITLRGRRHR